MNTKHKGDITMSKILSVLLELGETVLFPWGDNDRYDLAVDRGNGRIDRIQCKTGRLRDGVIKAKLCSVQTHRKGVAFSESTHKYNKSQIDTFGIYCPETAKCYLVPIEEASMIEIYLRIEPTKNNQAEKIKWAKDYEIMLP